VPQDHPGRAWSWVIWSGSRCPVRWSWRRVLIHRDRVTPFTTAPGGRVLTSLWASVHDQRAAMAFFQVLLCAPYTWVSPPPVLHGRALLSRVISAAPTVLAPGGQLLLVHSALCGVQDILYELESCGLQGEVVQECTHPFGPVLTERAQLLESRGLVHRGVRTERLVVIKAQAARVPATRAS